MIGQVSVATDNLTNVVWDGLEVEAVTLDFLAAGSPAAFTYKSTLADLFGRALAWGNFDGSPDRQDLVIGAPGVTVSGLSSAGIIATLRYEPSSPSFFTAVAFDRGPLSGAPATDAGFGQALAAGEFNGDSRDDLAIRTATDVQIMYGVQGVGLQATGNEPIFTSADLGLASPPTINGGLTTGDFNCDGFEDLAVGDPLEAATPADPDAGVILGAGAVMILYGSAAGLDKNLRQRVDLALIGGAPPSSRFFGGGELAAGNFNGDSHAGRPCVDLAVHSGEGSGSISNGAVYVLYGSSDGLRLTGSQHLVQGGPAAGGTTIKDASEPGDGFGEHLAITRADLDRYDDLVSGAFNEDTTKGAAPLRLMIDRIS